MADDKLPRIPRKTPEDPTKPKHYGPFQPNPAFALSWMETHVLRQTSIALEALGHLFEADEERFGVSEILKFIWKPLAEICDRLEQARAETKGEGGEA